MAKPRRISNMPIARTNMMRVMLALDLAQRMKLGWRLRRLASATVKAGRSAEGWVVCCAARKHDSRSLGERLSCRGDAAAMYCFTTRLISSRKGWIVTGFCQLATIHPPIHDPNKQLTRLPVHLGIPNGTKHSNRRRPWPRKVGRGSYSRSTPTPTPPAIMSDFETAHQLEQAKASDEGIPAELAFEGVIKNRT